MIKQAFKSLPFFTRLGLLLGGICGGLYGIGGFAYDLNYTGVNKGTLLALNSLWAMPLIGACLGLSISLFFRFVRYCWRKLVTAKR